MVMDLFATTESSILLEEGERWQEEKGWDKSKFLFISYQELIFCPREKRDICHGGEHVEDRLSEKETRVGKVREIA